MKNFYPILIAIILAAITGTLFAADNVFPIGAWLGQPCLYMPSRYFMVDTAGKCGIRYINLASMERNCMTNALNYCKSRNMKAFPMYAMATDQWNAVYTRHNLGRFTNGIYVRYEADTNKYFAGHQIGHAADNAWVSDSGEAGYSLYRDTVNCNTGLWWLYRNSTECRMPFTGDSLQPLEEALCRYTVKFRIKYQNYNSADTAKAPVNLPICRIAWQKLYDGGEYNGQPREQDTLLITGGSFTGPDVYKEFSLTFTRTSAEQRWVDFPVYSYGNKRLFVDWVEMQDAVWDSLSNDYNYVYSQAIQNIAETYADTSVVFRFYLRDEPVRSQLDAYYNVDRQLRRSGSGIPGFSIVVSQYPTSFGQIADTGRADTAFYEEFVAKTDPAQLAIDILPLFGDSARQALGDAYETSPGCYRTPVDSGFYFQKQLDIFCKFARSANRTSNNHDIPWWIQLQSFGDYKGPDTTFIEGRWRVPTARELKCMANLSLAHGAKGLFYYTFSEGLIEYSGYTTTGQSELWTQLAIVDTLGRVRDTSLYNAVKDLNQRIATLSSTLLNIVCDISFRMNDNAIPVNSIITGISDSLVQVGLFHNKANSGDKYFMLVNRHCLPTDTLTVTVNISSASTFFIADMLTGQPASGQLASGSAVPFSYKLQPGEGRLFRIVPFTAQLKINQNTSYTNFKFVQLDNPASSSMYSVDSVQIKQKYYTKTLEDTAARPDYSTYYWEVESSEWLPYSSSSIQYLANSLNNNSNIFDLQFKIGGGKILTPKYSSQIYFNDDPPSVGAISINNNAIYSNNQTVNIKISGTDLFPGLYQMRFAESPFGNAAGYVNLVKNSCFDDTTSWALDNAEFYEGFLHLKGYHTGPGPAQIGSSAKQIIPGADFNVYKGKLLRLRDDIYVHDVVSSYKIVDVFYADTSYPNSVRLLEKSIASEPEVIWKAASDTFTLVVDTLRQIDRMEISYNIWGIEVPPNPPDPGTLFNTIVVDNICLEPVELKTGAQPDAIPPISTYIYDGWDYADTNYSISYQLSAGDGTKRIYMQLNDLAGNNSLCPGWSDAIVLDMTVPFVGVTSPVSLSYVNEIISIRGYAWDVHFANWILEFKRNNTETWGQLSSGISPIHYKFPQTLCLWNTETVNDGLYLLRQTGYDLAGNCKSETIYVYIANNTLPREAITADFALFNSLPVDGTVDAFGNIYATDTQADKIWKFSPNGDSLLCFGYKYTGQDTLGFNHPKGIAVDDSGYIWVTDCYQSKIKKYDGQGNYNSTIGQHGNKAGEFNQPIGIIIKNNYIYVADHLNDRVQVFNKDGNFVRQFGVNILKQPAGIAVRQDEESCLIYVSDSKNNRIAIFDTLGNMIDSLGSGLNLSEPWDICFDCNNNLYIADVYNNRIVQLDSRGNKLLTFGVQGQEAGEFKLPQGLAVSPDGKYVYVIDTHNDRIQRFKMYFDISANGPQMSGRRVKPASPIAFSLGQSYPNPSAFDATINYALPKEAMVKFNIYNTLGQKVRSLVNESQMPGYYSIKWDSKDVAGIKTAAGVYFYRIEAGEYSATKKMVVIK